MPAVAQSGVEKKQPSVSPAHRAIGVGSYPQIRLEGAPVPAKQPGQLVVADRGEDSRGAQQRALHREELLPFSCVASLSDHVTSLNDEIMLDAGRGADDPAVRCDVASAVAIHEK